MAVVSASGYSIIPRPMKIVWLRWRHCSPVFGGVAAWRTPVCMRLWRDVLAPIVDQWSMECCGPRVCSGPWQEGILYWDHRSDGPCVVPLCCVELKGCFECCSAGPQCQGWLMCDQLLVQSWGNSKEGLLPIQRESFWPRWSATSELREKPKVLFMNHFHIAFDHFVDFIFCVRKEITDTQFIIY